MKSTDVIKKYLKSVENDPTSAICWCFVAIQRMVQISMKENPELIRRYKDDIFINNILNQVVEFSELQYKEIQQQKKEK